MGLTVSTKYLLQGCNLLYGLCQRLVSPHAEVRVDLYRVAR